MEILGVGPMELILVLIIALMVFGPDRLPEIGAKLGATVRTMRRTTREFSREIEQTRQAIEEPMREVTQPIQEIRDSVGNIAPAMEALSNPRKAVQAAIMKEFREPDEPSGPGAPAAPAPTGLEAAAAVAVAEAKSMAPADGTPSEMEPQVPEAAEAESAAPAADSLTGTEGVGSDAQTDTTAENAFPPPTFETNGTVEPDQPPDNLTSPSQPATEG